MDLSKQERVRRMQEKNRILREDVDRIKQGLASTADAPTTDNTEEPRVRGHPKESLKQPLDIEEIKKSAGLLKNVMQRFRNENLSVYNINDSILGTHPEVYEEGIQCDIEKELILNSESEDEEEIKKEDVTSYRKSIFNSKPKSNSILLSNQKDSSKFSLDEKIIKGIVEEREENKPLKSSKVSDETRKQILNSHEMTDFITSKAKYVERV
jgi:hypothetical protein